MSSIRQDISQLREIITWNTEELHTTIALDACDRLESLLDATIANHKRPGGLRTQELHEILKEDL